MKFVYIIIVIAILGIVVLFITNSTAYVTETDTTPKTTQQTSNTEDKTPIETTNNEEELPQTTNESESSVGNDAGMEFPIVEPEEEASTPAEETVPEELPNNNETGSAVKVFNVTGKNYEFSVKSITVKEGDTVRINIESIEGFHDWVIDEFDAATDQVSPGVSSSVEFVADKKGVFEYYCSVGNHRARGMVGVLTVE